MKKLIYYCLLLYALVSCNADRGTSSDVMKVGEMPDEVTMSKEVLFDKIRGGWAGQTIGCTYGGPTEFKFKGTMIQDYQQMVWYDDYIRETFELDPGLYDDVYLDFTFVEVIDRLGFNAPSDSFALAFAREDYKLWHANQAARYNILNGIMPPESGHWMNNPHADDIDFQIEADFAGMLSPGMINSAVELCDRTGHIMNYGDGWYGGVFMAGMYSTAFVTDNMELIIQQGLEPIPVESKFYKTINAVRILHRQYPDDWKKCWFEVEKRFSSEKGCPEGVYNSFNIDASINAAYVVMGLLYGDKDFYKTMDIATRCGQDSDCNPATAAGILGVVLGYDKIPSFWKPAIEKVEDTLFPYSQLTLKDIYEKTNKHALMQIAKSGGSIEGDNITIQVQTPYLLRYEESFEGMFPAKELLVRKDLLEEDLSIDFNGTGIVVLGNVKNSCIEYDNSFVALLDVYIDGEKIEQVKMPIDYITRKYDIFHKYMLPSGPHKLVIKWVNQSPDFRIYFKSYVVWDDKPAKSLESAIKQG